MATIIGEPPRLHVLAVDDSLTDRKLIEKLLKVSSFNVTTVESGSKALEFLGLMEEVEVNLIITDYCMPGMSGYDLLKKIKESSSLKDIPVVIMSSENAPSRINRCMEEGAKEFLLKPVKLSDMKKLRPHILRGHYKEQGEEEGDDVQNIQQKRKDTSSSSEEFARRRRRRSTRPAPEEEEENHGFCYFCCCN